VRLRLWSALRSVAVKAPPAEPSVIEPGGLRVLFVGGDGAVPDPAADLLSPGIAITRERSGDGGFYRAATEAFDLVVIAAPVAGVTGCKCSARSAVWGCPFPCCCSSRATTSPRG
jgi:hypothetical protein